MDGLLGWFDGLSFGAFVGVVALANVLMYLGSWGVVAGMQAAWGARGLGTLNEGRPRLSRSDVLVSWLVVAINVAVAVPGWLLWKRGAIELVEAPLGRDLVDLALMMFVFDGAMYALHRLVHVESLYRRIHRRHHGQVDVGGLSFYIMNPAEALAFGGLLLGFLALRPFSLEALLGFLFLNWAYGTLGHSGLGSRHVALRWLMGGSRFHYAHHVSRRGNYGFYTPLWDRVFGSRI